MDTRFQALFQLRNEIKSIKPYDGWSGNDMRDHFIEENGYHPLEQYQLLKLQLIDEYLDNNAKTLLSKVAIYPDDMIDLWKHYLPSFDDGKKEYIFNEDDILNKQIYRMMLKIIFDEVPKPKKT